MPYYSITILTADGITHHGIRMHPSIKVDVVFIQFMSKAHRHFGFDQVKKFDCVQISGNSEEYKAFAAEAKRRNRPVEDGYLSHPIQRDGSPAPWDE